jgi:hypothetical protein
VDVQEFRWDKGGTVEAEEFIFYEKKMKIINWMQVFCTPQNSNQHLRD